MSTSNVKVIVLGTGMVGSAIARDLSSQFAVKAVDVDARKLEKLSKVNGIDTEMADLANPENIQRLIDSFPLVVSAVPGHLGQQTLRRVIASGKDVVDIAFAPEDPFELDKLARKQEVTAVVDAGVAPGMSNLILGYETARMSVERYACYVGGLPVVRTWPFQYKAPFSPADVIEEYTRPARRVANGRIVIEEALSNPEMLEFEEIGTLEAFNTDGLRTLVKTVDVPDMGEKTLRYPGHAEYMRFLKAGGFFEKNPLKIGGVDVVPLDVTSALLFSRWQLQPEEEEFTVMRIIVEGRHEGRRRKVIYHLLDRYDRDTGISSMARTTGYACTAILRLLADGDIGAKGICPLEYIGKNVAAFEKVMAYQRQRNIHYRRTEEVLGK